ncbi:MULTISPECIES: hypothetical protein [unclassified Sphingomonas]|uniref:hypothetical protein n=1 Tax=unclassified Sphingomonas TaxID=196159 RepID=UPI00104359EE|nr:MULTISPECIES: hypothetical protein [unclassified Sphingomonas]MBB3694925.1 hypothetical protein [Sphingomonas sp. BK580]TCP32461.1 hypothetical protein EV292_10893 [Sphingomonas sp. BK235]
MSDDAQAGEGAFERDADIEDDPHEAGTKDPGKDGEDEDILGKKQDELTADDLRGDTRQKQGQ